MLYDTELLRLHAAWDGGLALRKRMQRDCGDPIYDRTGGDKAGRVARNACRRTDFLYSRQRWPERCCPISDIDNRRTETGHAGHRRRGVGDIVIDEWHRRRR